MQSVDKVRSGRRRSRLILAGGLALLGLVGCDLITGTDPPQEARVELTGSGVEGPIMMITSSSFLVGAAGPEDVFFRQADTTFVNIPFDGTFSMRETQQFLVRVPSPEDHDPRLAIRVFIDGDLSHTQEQVMDGGLLQFHYTRF